MRNLKCERGHEKHRTVEDSKETDGVRLIRVIQRARDLSLALQAGQLGLAVARLNAGKTIKSARKNTSED